MGDYIHLINKFHVPPNIQSDESTSDITGDKMDESMKESTSLLSPKSQALAFTPTATHTKEILYWVEPTDES